MLKYAFLILFLMGAFYLYCVECWRIGCLFCWLSYPFLLCGIFAVCEKYEKDNY